MNQFTRFKTSRRGFLQGLLSAGAAAMFPLKADAGVSRELLTRPIPSTGERIPIIGMGSHITFNVGNDREARLERVEVLRTFLNMGGRLVDSSPMYGSAEAVIGFCIDRLGTAATPPFSATKVWTRGREDGMRQIDDSHRLWGLPRMNLNQVHNLVDWRTQLDTLQQMKANAQLQYVGITTSHGRRHRDLEQIMRDEPIDFVQLTYHIENRRVEDRLLPLALEKGIAVIVNRPFRKGALFDDYQRYPLPTWAAEFDCVNWAQFFLKFAVSHPAVTCAIPATSRVDHMIENMGACYGRLPDPQLRRRMITYLKDL
jgi:diketogulonate reductase-like aldo/keto reductase